MQAKKIERELGEQGDIDNRQHIQPISQSREDANSQSGWLMKSIKCRNCWKHTIIITTMIVNLKWLTSVVVDNQLVSLFLKKKNISAIISFNFIIYGRPLTWLCWQFFISCVPLVRQAVAKPIRSTVKPKNYHSIHLRSEIRAPPSTFLVQFCF